MRFDGRDRLIEWLDFALGAARRLVLHLADVDCRAPLPDVHLLELERQPRRVTDADAVQLLLRGVHGHEELVVPCHKAGLRPELALRLFHFVNRQHEGLASVTLQDGHRSFGFSGLAGF